MLIKINKQILLILSMLIISASQCAGVFELDFFTISPSEPTEIDNLECRFMINGQSDDYTVSFQWLLNDAEYLNEEFSAESDQLIIRELDQSETEKGQKWTCNAAITDNSDNYQISIQEYAEISEYSLRHSLEIENVTFSPSDGVKSGHALLTSALIKNNGIADEEEILVRVSIPELGISSSDYIEEIMQGSSVLTEELFMRIAACTTPGTYDVHIIAEYDDGSKNATRIEQIEIIEGDYCSPGEEDVTENNSKIKITYLRAKCDPSCDDDSLEDDLIIKDVQPGAAMTLIFRAENMWPKNTDDHDIKNIELECTLEDIGDDEEKDDSINFGKLRPGEDSDKEEMHLDMSFQAIDNEDYSIECTLSGTDEDGTEYEESFDITAKVKKVKHNVKITKATINPQGVSCSRNFGLTVEVKNLGSKDEKNLELTIASDSLGISKQDMIFDLDEGDYDDKDSEWDKTYSFSASKNLAPGSYPISIKVTYDNGREKDTQTATLNVYECIEPVETSALKNKISEKAAEEIVEVKQMKILPGSLIAEMASTEKEDAPINYQEESFRDSYLYTVLLITLLIGAAGAGFLMVAGALKK